MSVEPVVQGPIAEMAEVAHADIEDTAKLVPERFECQSEDTYGTTSACGHRGFLLLVNKLVIAFVEWRFLQLISPSPQQREDLKKCFREKILARNGNVHRSAPLGGGARRMRMTTT
jgi:hypothetical protein